ncbi:uncharacterized protein LOC141697652 [Apium graveolens]|uniref:uncharacterized protein LOC141697652 n=1 Tax=Apium graveolens TaxID=4045 RepID=UPI003D78BE2B
MFKDQIGKTMEVYIDDMVVKSVNAENHFRDLQEVFDILRLYNMKMNSSKCNFVVSSRKFLGHMLTGRVAVLNRFISRSSDICKLFYDVLRKNKGFTWSEKHEAALHDLKTYLTTPPLLSKPLSGEYLYVYLSVTDHAVSGVLVKEGEGVQTPIYYVSKSLVEAETRKAIKSQALDDFVADFSPSQMTTSEEEFRQIVSITDAKPWTLYTDGALNVNGTGLGLGLVLKSPEGDMIAHSICCSFKATNNEAEYEALIIGLFISDKTEAFYRRWNINLIKSTPRHPQANRQAKSSNKIIINNLKRRLTSCKGKWAKELPWVLWSDMTTPKTLTGQTPYSLVYATEAVLPIELMMPKARYRLLTTSINNTNLSHDIDIVDEHREMANIRMASYQQRVANTYNKHVHIRAFRVRDLMLRKTFQNTMDMTAGKFADT